VFAYLCAYAVVSLLGVAAKRLRDFAFARGSDDNISGNYFAWFDQRRALTITCYSSVGGAFAWWQRNELIHNEHCSKIRITTLPIVRDDFFFFISVTRFSCLNHYVHLVTLKYVFESYRSWPRCAKLCCRFGDFYFMCLGRTGTNSTQTALNLLGFHTYHMVEVIQNSSRGDLDLWLKLAKQKQAGQKVETRCRLRQFANLTLAHVVGRFGFASTCVRARQVRRHCRRSWMLVLAGVARIESQWKVCVECSRFKEVDRVGPGDGIECAVLLCSRLLLIIAA
jgi:hypothetical protein